MPWRDTLLKYFGPGLLGGARLGTYLALLRENRFAITPSCWHRATVIASQTMQVSMAAWLEERRFGCAVRRTTIEPPLFLLGHWRSGTTHLHNLLSLDEHFGFPNTYQCLLPNTFLSMESSQSKVIGFFFPKRRPIDNVEWTMQSPQEDEFALATMTGLSPYVGWAFPENRQSYDRFLTFDGEPEEVVGRWKEGLRFFLQKVTQKVRRPLVLKSPPHTARIKLLLELFPGAKFVHIHRDPYVVFPSSKRTFQINFVFSRLQRAPSEPEINDWILDQYVRLYDAFFHQRSLIPDGQYYELGYEQLERNPIGEMQQLYDGLSLPGFAEMQAKLKDYLASISGYRKNEYLALAPELRSRIATQWRRSFDEWDYPV